MFNVDDDHSYNTIHNRPSKTYAGSPGADSIDLDSTPRKDTAGRDLAEGLDTSALSKEDLIKLHKTANFNPRVVLTTNGSRPINDSKSSFDGDNIRSLSSGHSSSSSTSSSAESVSARAEADKG